MPTPHDQVRDALRGWLEEVLRVKSWSMTKLASKAGVDQATITRFMSGARAGTMRADTIAKISRVAGMAPPAGLGAELGFGEPGVQPIHDETRGLSPDQSVWQVTSPRLVASGFLPGDRFILDMAEEPRPGDYVLANIYRLEGDGAETVLRNYQPPFLTNPAGPLEPGKSEYIDNERVQIKGVIVERWRRWR